MVIRPVDSIGVVVIQVFDAVLQLIAAVALVNAEDKEADVGIQGELVHGVNSAHVIEHEEQHRGPLGTRTVSLYGSKRVRATEGQVHPRSWEGRGLK